MSGAKIKKRVSWCLFVAAVFSAVILISKYNELTFPYPWNDEARFFLPSWSFSMDGSLKPAIINAREGIFWVPHGYYVLFGVLLGVFGRTIEVARAISQILVASAASLAVVGIQRISRSYWVAVCTAAILVSPPVILSANEVRMECVVVFLFSLSILFASMEQEILAFSCLLFSTLFHPALSIGLVFYSAFLLAKYMLARFSEPHEERTTAMLKAAQYGFLLAVLTAVVFQAVFVVRHYPVFHAHMAYQTNRKLGRSLVRLLVKPQGIIFLVESLFVVCSLYLLKVGKLSKQSYCRDLLPAMSLSFGLDLYGVLGAEFQYDVYCLSFAPAILVGVAHRMIQLVQTKKA
jgi:hypothetical protein